MARVLRRSWIVGAPLALWAGGARAGAALPPIPIHIRVVEDGEPVATTDFVDDLVRESSIVYAEHEISFSEAKARGAIDAKWAALETRADRDGLADLLVPGVANVFVVRSLRDVDDPKRFRMGVMWRCLKNLKKRYIIVAASAMPTTLAHELGHFLGLPHASVKNNLMSYDRDEGAKVFLDEGQGRTCRRTARALFAKKEIVAG